MADWDLEQLYARHRQGLFTLALSVTGCAARAEDAVHEAFVRLCRTLPAHAADPVAYAFMVVRNAAIDQVRRHNARRPSSDDDAPMRPAASIYNGRVHPANNGAAGPHGGADASAPAVSAETERVLADAMLALGADQREVIVLHVYGGLTFAQVADVIGVPLPTAVSRYRRGLERLRTQIEGLV